MLYNFFSENFEYDECNAKGSCSVPPSISALQEVIIISLCQLAYYILKLRDFDKKPEPQEKLVIETLATIISTTDYSDEQLLNIVSNIYINIVKTKDDYKKLCEERSLPYKELKPIINLTPQMNLSQILALGEKAFLLKYKKISANQKNMRDLLLAIIKSAALNTSRLGRYNYYPQSTVDVILKSLNVLNYHSRSIDSYKKQIKILAAEDILLTDKVLKFQYENFGKLSSTEVSFSTSKGKAILVSGENFMDLKRLLSVVEGKDIDVYTHDDLLIAHSFEAFKKYKNLKGHFGTCNENCILDFATFPGAILLTANSGMNTEYLYRGRLFTTSKILPKGVSPLEENDFTPLIESCENSKGFAKGQIRLSELVGVDMDDLRKKFNEIKEKIESKQITQVVILGLSSSRREQQDYFVDFVKQIPENVYTISFSFYAKHPNFLHLNVGNNRGIVYDILKKFFEYVPADITSFFITRCDVNSISNMISLYEYGVKNIFINQCQSNVINPAVLACLDKVYGIKSAETVINDVKKLFD